MASFNSSPRSTLLPNLSPHFTSVVQKPPKCHPGIEQKSPQAQGNHKCTTSCIYVAPNSKPQKRCNSHLLRQQKVYPVNACAFEVSEPAIERQPTHKMTLWHLVAEITLWVSRGPATQSQWVLAGIRFLFIPANGCLVFNTGGTSIDDNLALISQSLGDHFLRGSSS